MPAFPDALSLFALLATLAIAGFVRGFAGFGAGLIAIPIVSAIYGPQIAVPLLGVTDFTLSLRMLPPAFRRADWKTVLPAALAAVITVPMGAFVLTHSDPIALRWGLSISVVLMLMLLMSGWRYRGTPKAALSAMVGAIAGIFGGTGGIAGPPVITYWMSGPADKIVLRANLITFFAFTSVAGITSFAVAGLINIQVGMLAVIAAPVYIIAIWLGVRTQNKASEKQFRTFAFTLIVLAAIIGLPLLDPLFRGG